MLSQQEIQKMLEEIGLNDLDEKSRLEEFDKWTKLTSGTNNVQMQTFIEIASTTVTEDEQGSKYGELGRNPQ
jgi:hypothetical protein